MSKSAQIVIEQRENKESAVCVYLSVCISSETYFIVRFRNLSTEKKKLRCSHGESIKKGSRMLKVALQDTGRQAYPDCDCASTICTVRYGQGTPTFQIVPNHSKLRFLTRNRFCIINIYIYRTQMNLLKRALSNVYSCSNLNVAEFP